MIDFGNSYLLSDKPDVKEKPERFAIQWLDYVSLIYDFNPKMLSKTPIRGMSFGVTGRNLAILKKNVPHIDPEAAVSSGNVQGLEGGQLPSTRNISFSLTVKF